MTEVGTVKEGEEVEKVMEEKVKDVRCTSDSSAIVMLLVVLVVDLDVIASYG